ncbi:glycosyltransferase family 2 protein [Pantanalinema sp. GBBB05]|uniref:glycosyltransferase family 2 protein n=1 Tax=Pantanalinema sp. GBBB05 TaxID=2604139 RepID=UPI001D6DBBE3|nr:glycosyltransferase family 2 protein [Pantanalinema sp. GBBB05]
MNLNNPVVSVIMPCYNQGQYLDEAVDSVLAQTYPDFEIIVINDGSTDEATVDRLQHYEKPGVQVIHTENRGPSSARNTGIQRAKGRYILPLDADDRIAPTYMATAIPILESNSNIGLVYSGAEFFGEKTGRSDLPPYSFPAVLLGNMIFNSGFYRKADWETVGGYNTKMVYGWEDYDFWLSIIELGREVVYLPELFYCYRQLPNSRSERLTRDYLVKSYEQIYRNHSKLYSEHISALFQHIIDLRDDVHQTHTRLRETQLDVHQTHTQLGQTQLEVMQLHKELGQLRGELGRLQGDLERSQTLIAAMKSSKFWQLRAQWFKLKQMLGFKVNGESELLL